MTQIELRRDTAANWNAFNPVLSSGEPGFETDTGKLKIGNGAAAWNSLSYFAASAGGSTTLAGDTDTAFTTLVDGDLLTYNSGTSRWINLQPRSQAATGPGGTRGANTGAAVTIPTPTGRNGFNLYWGIMTANLTVTMPPPAAGVSFTARFDQDAVGNRTLSFAASPTVEFPGATESLITTALAENWINFESDGIKWQAFPMTAAATGGGGGTTVSDFTNVKSSGAVGDGTTNDFTAVRSAITAGLTGSTGASFYFPPGTYYLNPASLSFLLTTNPSVPVEFFGDGPATTIKLSANCPSFLAYTASNNIASAGSTVANLTVRDLTVDCNNVAAASNGTGVVVLINGTSTNVDNVRVERVDTINVGAPVTSTPVRSNVEVNISGTGDSTSATQYSVTNVTVRGCRFGKSGGGGNYGCLIQSTTTSPQQPNLNYDGTAPQAPGYFDNIRCDRVQWSAGTVPSSAFSFIGGGIQIGGAGWGDRVYVRECSIAYSPGYGVEIDAFRHIFVENCQFQDCIAGGLYLNNAGGLTDAQPNNLSGPGAQTVVIAGCRYRMRDRNVNPATMQTPVLGIGIVGGSPHGAITIEDCVLDVMASGNCPVLQYQIMSDFKSLRIGQCRSIVRNGQFTFTTNGQVAALPACQIAPPAGRGRVDIQDFLYSIQGFTANTSTFTTPRFDITAVQLDGIPDTDINIDGVQVTVGAITTNGTNVPTLRSRHVYIGNALGTATDTPALINLQRNYYDDTGQVANMGVTSSAYAATTAFTTERRFAWIAENSTGTYRVVGPVTDSCIVTTFGPPTNLTTTAGFKAGALKRIDSSNYVEAYVYDTGTLSATSYLCLDKVVAGTRSTLLTAGTGGAVADANLPSGVGVALATRLANGTTGAVWLKPQGTVMQAAYFTAAALPTGVSSAPTASISATLGTTDTQSVGPVQQGFPAWSLIPLGTSASVTKFNIYRMGTTRGRISGLSFGPMGTPVKDGWGVQFNWSSLNNRVGGIRITDCDFSGATGNTGFIDVGGYDATQGQSILRQRIVYAGNNVLRSAASSTITFSGTTFTYTNQNAIEEDVFFYTTSTALTTPFAQVTRNQGGGAQQIIGASGNFYVRLQPGDQLTLTQSANTNTGMTLRRVPVL